VKTIFCRALDNGTKRKRTLYMSLLCGMKRERSNLSGEKGVFSGPSVSWKNPKPDGTDIGYFS
jgi:hypothetical protein